MAIPFQPVSKMPTITSEMLSLVRTFLPRLDTKGLPGVGMAQHDRVVVLAFETQTCIKFSKLTRNRIMADFLVDWRVRRKWVFHGIDSETPLHSRGWGTRTFVSFQSLLESLSFSVGIDVSGLLAYHKPIWIGSSPRHNQILFYLLCPCFVKHLGKTGLLKK